MSRETRFWDRIAKTYFNKPIKDEEAYRIKLATTQDYLRADMEILEVGCGTGGTAIAHAPYVSHVTAADISGRMIDFGERRKTEAGMSNVTFHRASVAESLKADRDYDAILMLSILHLLDDPKRAIRDACNILKPGGYLVSNTPCLSGQLGLMSPILKLGGKMGLVPRVIQEFSEADLMGWLKGAGLKTVHHWQPDGGNSLFTISQRS